WRGSGRAWWGARPWLLPHDLLRRRQRVDEGGTAEQALGVLHERGALLGQLDPVVVEPPQERRDRDVQHGELLAEHVLLLGEYRRDLRQVVAYDGAPFFRLFLRALLDRLDVG